MGWGSGLKCTITFDNWNESELFQIGFDDGDIVVQIQFCESNKMFKYKSRLKWKNLANSEKFGKRANNWESVQKMMQQFGGRV